MEATSVLVLSTDALVAALLGALVEIEGCTLQFARPGESARDALRRIRPRVVLVDREYPDVCSPGFIGPAKMMGTGVVLFGRPGTAAALRQCAERYDVGMLELPPAPGDLHRALSRVIA